MDAATGPASQSSFWRELWRPVHLHGHAHEHEQRAAKSMAEKSKAERGHLLNGLAAQDEGQTLYPISCCSALSFLCNFFQPTHIHTALLKHRGWDAARIT